MDGCVKELSPQNTLQDLRFSKGLPDRGPNKFKKGHYVGFFDIIHIYCSFFSNINVSVKTKNMGHSSPKPLGGRSAELPSKTETVFLQ